MPVEDESIASGTGPDEAVIDEQIAGRRGRASDRFEPKGRQPVEESSSAAGDPRRDHEPEFIHDVCGEQRLGDRNTGVNADIASRPILQVPHEFNQPAVDHARIGPLPVERRRCHDVLRDAVDERRERLDLAARPELSPLVVAATAKDDRVLRCDHSSEVGLHRVVPVSEEPIRILSNTVERQQLVHDDVPHSFHLRGTSMLFRHPAYGRSSASAPSSALSPSPGTGLGRRSMRKVKMPSTSSASASPIMA